MSVARKVYDEYQRRCPACGQAVSSKPYVDVQVRDGRRLHARCAEARDAPVPELLRGLFDDLGHLDTSGRARPTVADLNRVS